jgi:multisubunit Na+/H+ antiporter MnhB subunit
MKKVFKQQVLISALGLVLFAGCFSHQVILEQVLPENYELLGKAKGDSSGSLGMLATAYYFIPMGLNSISEKAYKNAVKSVPGATEIINVSYQED